MKQATNFVGALAIAFGTCATPALSQTLPLDLQPSSAIDEMNYVDKHIFFVMDFSGSMSESDKTLMRESIYDSFHHDPNFSSQLGRGAIYAMTFVAFSGRAHATETFIINSTEDAIEALEHSHLSNSSHVDIGSGTKISPALIQIANVLYQEETIRHIRANAVSVVIMTDDRPDDPVQASAEYNELVSRYNISFNAITLNESVNGIYDVEAVPAKADALNQYCHRIVTRDGDLGPMDDYGRRAKLQAGLCATVTTSQHQNTRAHNNPANSVLSHALTLAGF